MPLVTECVTGRPCFLVEHWLFGLLSEATRLVRSPLGELRNEGLLRQRLRAHCWVLRKQPLFQGADSNGLRVRPSGWEVSTHGSVRILRTA